MSNLHPHFIEIPSDLELTCMTALRLFTVCWTSKLSTNVRRVKRNSAIPTAVKTLDPVNGFDRIKRD